MNKINEFLLDCSIIFNLLSLNLIILKSILIIYWDLFNLFIKKKINIHTN